MIHAIFNKKGYGKEYFMDKRKDEFDNLRDNVNKTFQLLYEMRYKFVKENKLLQERIDKAIEILQEEIPIWEEWHWDGSDIDIESSIRKIYDILKGVNNE